MQLWTQYHGCYITSRYLFTEWEDPAFGARASCVHAALVDSLTSADAGEAVWEAIRRQTDMVSQLAYIVKELKVGRDSHLVAVFAALQWPCVHKGQAAIRSANQHDAFHSPSCRCHGSRRSAQPSGSARCCRRVARARS